MKTSDLISMSVRSLWRRKLRTALTILGVVIGATSIVMMLSLGLAMEQNMEEQFKSWGDLTLIEVHSNGGNESKLSDQSIQEMQKIANVERVIPMLTTNCSVTFGKYRSIYSFNVYAMSAEDLEAMGYRAVEGRDMEEGETQATVIGGDILKLFYKIGKKFSWEKFNWDQEPLEINLESDKITLDVASYDDKGKPYLDGQNGKVKEPKGISLRVVGILPNTSWEIAESIFVSPEVYDELAKAKAKYEQDMWGQEQGEASGSGNSTSNKKNKKEYDQVRVKVNDRNNVVTVTEAIKELGYNAYSNMEYIEQVEKQANSKRMALGGIGIISFFVAAIGIANTMMMSIYERTKEIGVMKVIGAKLVDIKRMFLVEALLIGFIGGGAGVIFSYMLSAIMNLAGEPIAAMLDMYGATTVSIIPLWLALAAIVFSTVVGLISGYFPAKKAMKLSALSAIKTD